MQGQRLTKAILSWHAEGKIHQGIIQTGSNQVGAIKVQSQVVFFDDCDQGMDRKCRWLWPPCHPPGATNLPPPWALESPWPISGVCLKCTVDSVKSEGEFCSIFTGCFTITFPLGLLSESLRTTCILKSLALSWADGAQSTLAQRLLITCGFSWSALFPSSHRLPNQPESHRQPLVVRACAMQLPTFAKYEHNKRILKALSSAAVTLLQQIIHLSCWDTLCECLPSSVGPGKGKGAAVEKLRRTESFVYQIEFLSGWKTSTVRLSNFCLVLDHQPVFQDSRLAEDWSKPFENR